MSLSVLSLAGPAAAAAMGPSVACTLRVCFGPVGLVSCQLAVLYGLFSETREGGGLEKSMVGMLMGVQGKGKVREDFCCDRRDVVWCIEYVGIGPLVAPRVPALMQG
jgi:hypothetical protein